MNRSHLTPNKLTYVSGIITMTASMLLSCNTTPMTAMTEEDHSFGTQGTLNDGITILESVPSQEAKQEVPGEVLVAGTADRLDTDAHSDSISIAELASIERRIGLDDTGSRLTDAERHNALVITQEKFKAAATNIQSIARMYNSNKKLKAESNETVRAARQKDSKNPNRDQHLDFIKLGAVGASAFALGGYMNNSWLNQQKEREAQKAREEADTRIRQLEEQIQALEANKRSQTAVDFHNHMTTLNSDTIHRSPHFFDASRLYSVHPVWAPLGVGWVHS